jgi:hypothetical protein
MKKVILILFSFFIITAVKAQVDKGNITNEYLSEQPTKEECYKVLNKLFPGINEEEIQHMEQELQTLILAEKIQTDISQERKKLDTYTYADGCCAYIVNVYIHSFLGITWGEPYSVTTVVGCIHGGPNNCP